MKKFFFIPLLMLLFFFNTYAQDIIPMDIFGNRFLIVDVLVNDSIKTKFILDTGNGIELVSAKFFDRIKGTAKPKGIFTGFQSVGSRIEVELFEVPSMQIGNYKKNNVVVIPYPPLDNADGIDGIVSMKFFEEQPFTMDFKAGKLILETATSLEKIARDAEVIPIFVHDNQGISLDIFLRLRLNHSVDIRAEFDTGTGIDVMINPYFFRALGIDVSSPNVKTEKFESENGHSQEKYTVVIPTIELVGSKLITQEKVSAVFLQEFIYEGLIGWQLFKNNLITIDYPKRRLMVK